MNPNGRIPTIIDHDAGDFIVYDRRHPQYLAEKSAASSGYSTAGLATTRTSRAIRFSNVAAWSWVQGHDWSAVGLSGFAHLQRRHDRIAARPAVQRGKAVPPTADLKCNGRVRCLMV